jgi:hypothetical protein
MTRINVYNDGWRVAGDRFRFARNNCYELYGASNHDARNEKHILMPVTCQVYKLVSCDTLTSTDV